MNGELAAEYLLKHDDAALGSGLDCSDGPLQKSYPKCVMT